MILIIAILLSMGLVLLVQMYYTKKIHCINLQSDLDNKTIDLKISLEKNIKLEKKLKTSDFYLKNIQELASIGIWEVYADKSKVSYFSDEMYKIISQDKNTYEPTFRNFKKLLVKEDRNLFTNSYYCTIKTKSDFIVAFSLVNSDGKCLRIESRAHHTFSKNGEYKSTFGIFLDSVQKHQVEHKLRNINKNLDLRVKEEIQKNEVQQEKFFKQSRMAQMGEMIFMIAHQWRQPLSAISSTSIDLQMQIDLDTFNLEEKNKDKSCQMYFKKELKEIDKLVKNLTNTIDDFRNFYKPNKNKHIGLIDESIKKALSIMRAPLKAKGIDIIEDYKSDTNLHYYMNEIMQVVLNILKNSQDNFLEKQIKKPKIIISTFDTDLNTVVNIIDNGMGIEESIIEKVFDPYFSTKDEKNGTGLSLYMSKIIISEHHGGDLYVTNYDNGVRFTIELKKELRL